MPAWTEARQLGQMPDDYKKTLGALKLFRFTDAAFTQSGKYCIATSDELFPQIWHPMESLNEPVFSNCCPMRRRATSELRTPSLNCEIGRRKVCTPIKVGASSVENFQKIKKKEKSSRFLLADSK